VSILPVNKGVWAGWVMEWPLLSVVGLNNTLITIIIIIIITKQSRPQQLSHLEQQKGTPQITLMNHSPSLI
jgi:hypothetical protein